MSKGIATVVRMTAPLRDENDVDALPLGAKTKDKARLQPLTECLPSNDPCESFCPVVCLVGQRMRVSITSAVRAVASCRWRSQLLGRCRATRVVY